MTSKEALEYMLYDYHFYEPSNEEDYIKGKEATKKMRESIEILDILKKSIKETGISIGDEARILTWELFDIKEKKTFKLFNITIENEEDFNKIIGWLNDK